MRTTVVGAIGAMLVLGGGLPAAAQGYYDAGGPDVGGPPPCDRGCPPCPCPDGCPPSPRGWDGPPPGWDGPPPAIDDDGYGPAAFEGGDGGVGVEGGYAGGGGGGFVDGGPAIDVVGFGAGHGLWIHGRDHVGFHEHVGAFARSQVSESTHVQTRVSVHVGGGQWGGGGHWGGGGWGGHMGGGGHGRW